MTFRIFHKPFAHQGVGSHMKIPRPLTFHVSQSRLIFQGIHLISYSWSLLYIMNLLIVFVKLKSVIWRYYKIY